MGRWPTIRLPISSVRAPRSVRNCAAAASTFTAVPRCGTVPPPPRRSRPRPPLGGARPDELEVPPHQVAPRRGDGGGVQGLLDGGAVVLEHLVVLGAGEPAPGPRLDHLGARRPGAALHLRLVGLA